MSTNSCSCELPLAGENNLRLAARSTEPGPLFGMKWKKRRKIPRPFFASYDFCGVYSPLDNLPTRRRPRWSA
eukprot:scaffold87879_cov21-Phaeocystis_antarctica.AAC.1